MFRHILVLAVLLSVSACATQPISSDAVEQEEQLQTRLEGKEQKAFLQDYAELLSKSGNHADAARILEKLRRENPADLAVTRQIATVYERSGELELALLARESIYRGAGDQIQDAAEYARVALLNRRYGVAREVYLGWISQSPPHSSRHITALNNLGYSYLLELDMVMARHWLGQAVAIDPLHGRARANLELLKRIQANAN